MEERWVQVQEGVLYEHIEAGIMEYYIVFRHGMCIRRAIAYQRFNGNLILMNQQFEVFDLG